MPALKLLESAQFTGFLDDELGKLSNLGNTAIAELRQAVDPAEALQERGNPTSLDVLSQYLTVAALFSDQLVTTDGWLILTPAWWPAFFDPQRYPLVQLLKSRFLVSYSRNGGELSELVATEARNGIASYAAVQKVQGFDSLRRILARHESEDQFGFVNWPADDMNVSLTLVLQEALTRIDTRADQQRAEVWDVLRHTFETERRNNSARQAWIRSVLLCDRRFEFAPDTVRLLAYIGVQAYHHSRALMLAARSSGRIGLATVPSLGASALYSTDLPHGDFLADEMIMLNVDSRRISDFTMLGKVLDPSTDVGACKEKFLTARAAAFVSADSHATYEEAALRYRDALNRTLGPIVEAPRTRLRRQVDGAKDALGAGAVPAAGAVMGAIALSFGGPITGVAGAVLGAFGGGLVEHYLGVAWKQLTVLHQPLDPVVVRDPGAQMRIAATISAVARQAPLVVPREITQNAVASHLSQIAALARSAGPTAGPAAAVSKGRAGSASA